MTNIIRYSGKLRHAGCAWESLSVVILMTLAASPARAQLVNDGATNILSNTNIIIASGFVTVGTNGPFTLLVLSDNCLLSNSVAARIGLNTAAKSNEVRLVSPTARWLMDSSLEVGRDGAFNRLTVSNGARVTSFLCFVGFNSTSASNNSVVVSGAGSIWSNTDDLVIGHLSGGNRFEVSDGGLVANGDSTVGNLVFSGNQALITGANSVWSNRDLTVGNTARSSQLVVSNGGLVLSRNAYLGKLAGGSNNLALVTGAGSMWSNQADLVVGVADRGNQLIITNAGTVTTSNLFVGLQAPATNSRVVVDGGTLRVTNAAGTGLLDVRRGTNVLDAGLVEVNQLLVTNTAGKFELNGGTFSAGKTVINNGQLFRVGNGVSTAMFRPTGIGLHTFANGLTFSGNTTISMQISKNGSVLTNDVLQVAGTLTYGGTLVVSNLGPTALGFGDRFKLFDATSYAGSFSSSNLPPLGSGLNWTNKLLVDGSIEVVGLSVQTLPASGFGQTSATLNGMANPGGLSASAWFEYGFTTNYGSVTPPQAVGSGVSGTNFSQALTGLLAGVSYHYRAVASNNFVVAFGTDRTFLTLSELITYLKASNTGAGDTFGLAVGASGDTVVVGARGEASNATGVNGNPTNNSANSAGAAYVFMHDTTNWSQQAYLKASNTGAGDLFGVAVAISGDTIVVGAQQEDSNASGVNGNQSNNSAPDSGAAYVFVRNGTNWIQQAYLKASNTASNDFFGAAVAISGGTIVVSSPLADSIAIDSGSAYVFVRNGTNWTQQAQLKASNAGAGDVFGRSLAIFDDVIVIGASDEASAATGVNGNQSDNSATDSGAAYVFVRTGTNWTQQAYLKASNSESFDQFGHPVAISGDTIVVGAESEDSNATGVNGNQADNSATNSGAAYVFVRNGTNWTQQAYLKASNTGLGDNFGGAVAISSDTIVIGAVDENSNATGVDGDQSNNSASFSGAAYVFMRNGTNWIQQHYLKASNTDPQDQFGVSVALAGGTVVVGAYLESSAATGVNGDGADKSAPSSGAAYVFDLSLLNPPLLSIAPSGVSQVTVSWAPPTPGFALQESLSLSPVAWSNSPSGQTNPVTIPVIGSTKFFRLFKP
jgi:T5SS/PEP-CTERM-associated repeat protein